MAAPPASALDREPAQLEAGPAPAGRQSLDHDHSGWRHPHLAGHCRRRDAARRCLCAAASGFFATRLGRQRRRLSDARMTTAVSGWVARLASALESPSSADWNALFGEECYWRDFLAFTWNILTLEGRPAIVA